MFCHGKTFSTNSKKIKSLKILAGISLVELMVVIVIAGVLAAITLPIYSEHLAKQKRLKAELTLQRISSALEEHFVVAYTYKHFALRDFGLPSTLKNSQYRIVLKTTGNHFRVSAVPFGTQAKRDSTCGSLTVTDTGEKHISGTGNVDKCWLG